MDRKNFAQSYSQGFCDVFKFKVSPVTQKNDDSRVLRQFGKNGVDIFFIFDA